MAKINGTKIKLMVGGTVVSNVTNCTLATARNMIDVTTKDSNAWKEVIPGLKDATLTGEAFVDNTATGYRPQSIYTDLVAGNLVAIMFYNITTGEFTYTAVGYFSKCDFAAGTEDAEKLSFSIQVTGAVTQTATT